jgi:DNA polymerase-3 subunit gamma/tau
MAKRKSPAAPDVTPPAPEGYTVLARRYRPQTFADLVGQEPVAQALTNALATNRVAHAYLFTGARGVGKTSAARILAKCLNCASGPTANPCNQCENCRAIAAGDDVDVLEIDAASNTGVDNIRDVRANVQFRPSRSRYKIYIIDEVHMLSKGAFNALLKTLEEPPPHVKFIFATTEVDKIPITILSRCQRFDFAGIGTPQIVERLREILAAEGMQADDEALELVARRAGGSMRDAQSLLDQLLAFGGDRLTVDQVHQLLGTANDDRVAALAGAALDGDPKQALELLGEAADRGLQLGELLDQLIGYWRDLMLVQSAGSDAPGLNVSSKHRPALVEQAQQVSLDTVLAGLDVLAATRARLRTTSHGRILAEMALVRLARLGDLIPLAQLAQAVASGQLAAPAEASKKKSLTPPPASGEPGASAPGGESSEPGSPSGGSRPRLATLTPTTRPGAADAPIPLTAHSLPSLWSDALAQLGQFHRNDLEKAGQPAISGPNTLVLRFAPPYNANKNRCLDPDKVARIEQLLLKLTGQKCHLRIEGTDGPPETVVAEGNATATGPTLTRTPPPRDEAAEPPLVQGVKDLLGAKPVKVDPGFGASASASPERAAAGAPAATATEET